MPRAAAGHERGPPRGKNIRRTWRRSGAARRFVMVMPAGNAAHIEARVAFGLGKPCYAVGPVAKTETLYRFFDRMFTSSHDSASWLASPLGDAR